MKSTKVTSLDPLYPDNLKLIDSPPQDLYFKGTLIKSDVLAVAIVGTRQPTKYGIEVATLFARELSRCGVTIISGLARGIDTVAHESCLEVKGRTIAVLAGGLGNIYPPENASLSTRICNSGAIVSEFEDEVWPSPKYFLRRNRVIAALSLAVVVVEGQSRSGTLSTANHAATLGREVFAVPGPITSPFSKAPHYLIREGASLALEPKDVLDYLNSVYGK